VIKAGLTAADQLDSSFGLHSCQSIEASNCVKQKVFNIMSADPGVEWVPVAGLLDAASSQLEVGLLLHTSVFSLFEAMSAVEIGNPKMDAGRLVHTRL
jgi:hypothetical protein